MQAFVVKVDLQTILLIKILIIDKIQADFTYTETPGAFAFLEWTLILTLRLLIKSTSAVLAHGGWFCKWESLP